MAEMAAAIGDEGPRRHTTPSSPNRSAGAFRRPISSRTANSAIAQSIRLRHGAVLRPDSRRSCAAPPPTIWPRSIRDNGNKMTTGFLGTRPLLPALSATGHHDLAGILMQQQRISELGLRGGKRRHHHLGTLELLHQGQGRPRTGHELVLPLCLRRGLRMDDEPNSPASTARRRASTGSGSPRARPAPSPMPLGRHRNPPRQARLLVEDRGRPVPRRVHHPAQHRGHRHPAGRGPGR